MKAAVTALEEVDGTKFKHGPISDIIYVAYGSSVDWAYDQVSCDWWRAAVLISDWSRASSTRSGWSCETSDTTASCCHRSVLSIQCRYVRWSRVRSGVGCVNVCCDGLYFSDQCITD